jgi:arylsulfatase
LRRRERQDRRTEEALRGQGSLVPCEAETIDLDDIANPLLAMSSSAGSILSLALLHGVLVPASYAQSAPNVVLLMADQLRWDYVTPTFTPNLMALKARGLTLRNTYTSLPSCTPARSSLLTGLSPWFHGMLGYGVIPVSWPLEMPDAMAKLGYSTVSVGKNHYENLPFMPNSSSPPPSHGWQRQLLYDGLGDGMGEEEFDLYDKWFQNVSGGQNPLKSGGLDWNSWRGAPYEYPEEWHPTSWVAAKAIAELNNLSSSSSPFFLKVSWHRPHSPYDPPKRLLDATPASELPPVYRGSAWDARYEGPNTFCGPANADAWCGRMPEAEFELTRRAYAANVKFMDEELGKVVDALAASPSANYTWVLFIADHGDGQGEHNLWRKTYPYELSAHVPGVIAWPSSAAAVIQRGSQTPLLAELRDVFRVL